MMFRVTVSILLLAATIVNAQQKKYVVATYRYADNDRIANIEPFAKHFGAMANINVSVVSYTSVHELLAAMKKGETDFVFINTFGYLLLREQSDAYAIAGALHVPEDASSTYQSAIVASTTSGIKTLQDVKSRARNLSLLLVNPGSTSGNLIPRLQFSKAGMEDVDKAFARVEYTRNHALTLQSIAENKGDIGAFGSEEYHKALRQDSALLQKVVLLWESQPIPLGPALYRKKLPAAVSRSFQEALLSLHIMNPEALESIKAGWTEAKPADNFAPITDAYYDQVAQPDNRSALKVIRQFAN